IAGRLWPGRTEIRAKNGDKICACVAKAQKREPGATRSKQVRRLFPEAFKRCTIRATQPAASPRAQASPSGPKLQYETFGEDRMSKHVARRSIARAISAAFLVAAFVAAAAPAAAQGDDPIKIGFSLALTGPLAPNGKQALLGAKIWEEQINAK